MPRFLLAIACAGLLGSVHARADENLPRQIRIQVEYIEAPHATVTEILQSNEADSGPKIHARLRALVKEKKARIMETCIVTTREGRRATLESIQEYIYPTENEPQEIANGMGNTPAPRVVRTANLQGRSTPTAFETRNLGVTLEIEASMDANGEIIDVLLISQIVDRLRIENWVEHVDQWGDASIRRPTIESLKVRSRITLQRGKFGLVTLLTPTKQTGGLDYDRKILLFVKADLVTPLHPPQRGTLR